MRVPETAETRCTIPAVTAAIITPRMPPDPNRIRPPSGSPRCPSYWTSRILRCLGRWPAPRQDGRLGYSPDVRFFFWWIRKAQYFCRRQAAAGGSPISAGFPAAGTGRVAGFSDLRRFSTSGRRRESIARPPASLRRMIEGMENHEGLLATALRAIAAFVIILALLGAPLAAVFLVAAYPPLAMLFVAAAGAATIRAIINHINRRTESQHAKRPPGVQ